MKRWGWQSKRKSRLVSMLCVFFLVFGLVGVFPETVHAEEMKAAKKIISVVYDDSGSMFDESAKWASANYAMQAFAALLNEQDEMYISYMSDMSDDDESNDQAVKLDLSDVDGAVRQIREDVDKQGYTEIKTIEVAMDQLRSIQESDEAAQFWLVILTDGQMTDRELNNLPESSLRDMLNEYAGTTMSNGSQVYIHYIGIGKDAVAIQADPSKGLESITGVQDVVPVLSDIANRISGRMKFGDSEVLWTDGKTAKLHSELPLYSISVFSQGSDATITKGDGETDLDVGRNIALKYPERDKMQTNTSLFGNAALLTNGNNIIPAGDYTITFSTDVSPEQVVFMYQPAIQMDVILRKNGVIVDDPSTLHVEDGIDIEVVPVNPETGDTLDDSVLPEGIAWSISYESEGQVQGQSDSRELTGMSVGEGENRVICTMQIPDYVPTVQTVSFSALVKIPSEYEIVTDQPDPAEYDRGHLGLKGMKGDPVTFRILGDGVPLTREDLNNFNISLKIQDTQVEKEKASPLIRFGFIDATPALKLEDDGTFTLYLKGRAVPAFMLKSGTYTVTVAVDGEPGAEAEGVYTVKGSLADWLDVMWIGLFLLLLIYLIYIFFIKAKFSGQTLKIQVYAPHGSLGEGKILTTQGEEVVLKKFGGDLFKLSKACSRSVGGIRVYADGNGGAYIKKRTVTSYEMYGNSSVNPIHNYMGVVGNLRPTNEKNRPVPDIIVLGSASFYLKQGNKLYRITLE